MWTYGPALLACIVAMALHRSYRLVYVLASIAVIGMWAGPHVWPKGEPYCEGNGVHIPREICLAPD